MNQPKISVIMGIYNCEKTLTEAIDSILTQTYTNWELILCDDGSTDGTYALAQKYKDQLPDKIILLKNEWNRKLSYTLNRCLEAASGELVARMDADDISHPDRFEKQVRFLREHPDIQLVGTAMRVFDESGFHGIRHAHQEPGKMVLRDGHEPFFHPTIMTYHTVFSSLGGYLDIQRTERVEDIDFYFRFFHHGFHGANIDEALYFVREDYNTLKRRTVKNRINGFRTQAYGYNLLNYPKRWLIKPALITAVKCLVPIWLVKILRKKNSKV